MANNGPPTRPTSAVPTQTFQRAESVRASLSPPPIEQPGANTTLQPSESTSVLPTPKSGSTHASTTTASSTTDTVVRESSRSLHSTKSSHRHHNADSGLTDSSAADSKPHGHHHKSHKGERTKSKAHLMGDLEVKSFNDYGFESTASIPGEIPLADIIIKSTLGSPNNAQQIKNIVQAFNYDAEVKEIITTDPVRGKRIEPGLFAIFSLNNKAILQPSTDQNIAKVLYPLSTSLVVNHGRVSQNNLYITQFGKHVLNVPTGSIAKARIGTDLLFYGEGPHFIHDANFVFDPDNDIFSLNQVLISHGTYRIISVPSGKIAKISIDATPYLLLSRSTPYVFNNPRFSFAIDNSGSFLVNATEKLIINGALKRLIVDTGEVAVISNNGQLEIIEPNSTGVPIVISNALVRVERQPFVSTNLQTIIFPSGNRYESAQTADGVKVKMKLIITYRIHDPKVAIKQLNTPEKILEHIEYCALTDMRNATQSCNFYAVQQTDAKSAGHHQDDGQPQYYQHIQDELKVKLREELRLIGVELGRLTFEEFLIDDKKVQEQRSTNAQAIASTTAQVSNLEKERTLKIQTVETALQVAKIQLEKTRNTEIANARAALEQAEISLKMERNMAESKANQAAAKERIAVENDLNIQRMQAKMKLEIALLEAEVITSNANAAREAEMLLLEAKGEMYQKFPKLLILEKARLQQKSMSSIKSAYVNEAVVGPYYGLEDGRRSMFFSDASGALVSGSEAK